MPHILRLVDQHDDPRDYFGHQQECAGAERNHQPPKLSTVQRCAAAHVKRKIAMDQRQRQGVAICRLEIGADDRSGESVNSQSRRGHRITSTDAPSNKTPDRDPAHEVDVMAERLASEKGGSDRRRRNERPGPRTKFDHRLLLVIKTTLGLLVGEPEGLGIRFGGDDRSRMQRNPDIKATRQPPERPGLM
jgi:hypothetical protein